MRARPDIQLFQALPYRSQGLQGPRLIRNDHVHVSEPRSIIGTVVLDSHTSSSRLIVSRPSQCPIHPEHSSLSQTRREFIGLYRLLDDGLETQYGHHPVPLFLPSDRGSLL